MKLGEQLLNDKVISQAQLDQALAAQAAGNGKKLGEILVELNLVTKENLSKYL